jgi:hypothetical protein
MSLQLEGNQIVSNGVSHPISSCSLDDYLDYRFTIRYLDRVCYILNPLETPVKIVLFYGSEARDGICKVTLPPGIGIIKVCSQSVPKVYSHHMSLAGISIGHQLIRLTHSHDSKQVVIIATTSPPTLKALGTAAVLGLTRQPPRPDALGKLLLQVPLPHQLVRDVLGPHITLLNAKLGRFSEEYRALRPCGGCIRSVQETGLAPAS